MKKSVFSKICIFIVLVSISNNTIIINASENIENIENIDRIEYLRTTPLESLYISDYLVKSGDYLGKIAKKNSISLKTLKELNGKEVNYIYKNKILKVSKVNGILHTVTEGDSLDSIANKYKVFKLLIVKYNSFIVSTYGEEQLVIGDKLLIPNGYIYSESGNELLSEISYKLRFKSENKNFYEGNCTWFISQYKNIGWRGNAKEWLKNAKNNGYKVGDKAKRGSIIVFDGKGYNREYGHVAIIMEVKKDTVIVSEMNYLKEGEVTYREVKKDDNAIKGYIYSL